MSNYTKGPWTITYDNCDNGSCQWHSVGPAKVEAPYNMTALERSEWESDVALVSACPEMLHANQCFVDAMNKTWFIEPYWNDDRIYDELPSMELANAYFAARDAIKKALGE